MMFLEFILAKKTQKLQKRAIKASEEDRKKKPRKS